jgi:uncharacterized membrane protein
MLFVLGLFLIAVGIGLSTVTDRVITYTNYMGFQIPTGYQTIYPYIGEGILMFIIGLILLIVAFIKIQSKKKPVSTTMEIPKTEQPS